MNTEPAPAAGGATLDTDAPRPVLRFARRLAHPPAKVWRAITDPAELAHWFPAQIGFPASASRPAAASVPGRAGVPVRAGDEITFTFPGGELAPDTGRITAYDPPSLFAFTWGADEFRLEVSPDGDGALLRMSQTLGGGRPWSGAVGAPRQAAGWDVCLAALARWLGGPPQDTPGWLDLDLGYLSSFGLAEGEVADGRIRFVRDLVRPAAVVWRTLTEDDRLRSNPHVTAGPVSKADDPHLLEYPAERGGVVRWELAGHEGGTELTLTHEVPPGTDVPLLLAAWRAHLELFVRALHGDPAPG
ncbi:MAG: hypothetical protein QOI35_97 [Cryptosporangiaceae bacterium]|nr:hypothetical protein [Cryptosporangiaceae bacterium]